VNILRRRDEGGAGFISAQTAGANRFHCLQSFAIRIERLLAHLGGVAFFLRGLQPETATEAALRRPHQIEPLVFLRSISRVIEHLCRIFEATFAQRHITETGARRGAESSRLAALGDYRQSAAARVERVLKMFARSFEIVIRKRDAASAQLEG